jgi:hypothetical protein
MSRDLGGDFPTPPLRAFEYTLVCNTLYPVHPGE